MGHWFGRLSSSPVNSGTARPAGVPVQADVVIVGAGPNGLMLACELGLAGVRPLVLDSLAEPSTWPKANGIMGQAVRLLDHRGLYERLTGDAGPPRPMPAFVFGALPLDLARLDPNPMFGLGAPQRRIEQVLGERAGELGVQVRRAHELLAFVQTEDAVELRVRGPEGPYRLRCRYLVGCDGARSVVRKQAGISFDGVTTADIVSRTAHVVLPDAVLVPERAELEVPGLGALGLYAWNRTGSGAYAVLPLASGVLSVSTMEWASADDEEPPTLEEVRASVRRVLGADLALQPPAGPGPHLLRRGVGRNTRLARSYRRGRVLLAGDAAHVHSAVGAPGLNVGLQDAADLGWKLAAEVHGWAPEGLLDTYESERRPAAERVIMHTTAQTALMSPGPEVGALRELVAELLVDEPATRRVAELLAGSDERYAMRPGDPGDHPLVGRFVPDLTLVTDGGPTRLAELLRTARPLLLDLGHGGLVAAAAGWRDRVDVVTATAEHPAATALLIRPDGYAAWAAPDDRTTDPASGLISALTTWFGSARRDTPAPSGRTSERPHRLAPG
jgi:2-polyprenyl-6-methoxyphenol hydroxylase-like FAD-dependent oxidoreductase